MGNAALASGQALQETLSAFGLDLSRACLVDGQWLAGEGRTISVIDKFQLCAFASMGATSADQVRSAVNTAHAAFKADRLSAYDRGVILERAAALVEQRADAFVRTMKQEAGFTAQDAAGEVRRCAQTLKLSAEEARRLVGEVVPLDGAPQQAGRSTGSCSSGSRAGRRACSTAGATRRWASVSAACWARNWRRRIGPALPWSATAAS
jgi:delta 1-pyrroline-5-carboxylate dehydrogenase